MNDQEIFNLIVSEENIFDDVIIETENVANLTISDIEIFLLEIEANDS